MEETGKRAAQRSLKPKQPGSDGIIFCYSSKQKREKTHHISRWKTSSSEMTSKRGTAAWAPGLKCTQALESCCRILSDPANENKALFSGSRVARVQPSALELVLCSQHSVPFGVTACVLGELSPCMQGVSFGLFCC